MNLICRIISVILRWNLLFKTKFKTKDNTSLSSEVLKNLFDEYDERILNQNNIDEYAMLEFEDFLVEFIQNTLDIENINEKDKCKSLISNILKEKNDVFIEEFDRYMRIQIYSQVLSELSKGTANVEEWLSEWNEKSEEAYINNYGTKDSITYFVNKTEELNKDVKKVKEAVIEEIGKHGKRFIKLANLFMLRQKETLLNYCLPYNQNGEFGCTKPYPDNYIFNLLENIAIKLTNCYLRSKYSIYLYVFPFDNVKYLVMCNKSNKFLNFAEKKHSLTKDGEKHKYFFKIIQNMTFFMMDTFNKSKNNKIERNFSKYTFNNFNNLLNELIIQKAVQNENVSMNIKKFISCLSKNDHVCLFFDYGWWNLGNFISDPYLYLFCLKARKSIIEKETFRIHSRFMENLFCCDFGLWKILYLFCNTTLKLMCIKFKESEVKTEYENLCYQIIEDAFWIMYEHGKDICSTIINFINKSNLSLSDFYENFRKCLDVTNEKFKNKTIEEIKFTLPELLWKALIKLNNDEELSKKVQTKTFVYAYQNYFLRDKFPNKINHLIEKVEEHFEISFLKIEKKSLIDSARFCLDLFIMEDEIENSWNILKFILEENGSKDNNNDLKDLLIENIKNQHQNFFNNIFSRTIDTQKLQNALLNAFLPVFHKVSCSKKLIDCFKQANEKEIICILSDLFFNSFKGIFKLTEIKFEIIIENLSSSISNETIGLIRHKFSLDDFNNYIFSIYYSFFKEGVSIIPVLEKSSIINEVFYINYSFMKDFGFIVIDKFLVYEILEEVFTKFLKTFERQFGIEMHKKIQNLLKLIRNSKETYMTTFVDSLLSTQIRKIFVNQSGNTEIQEKIIDAIDNAKYYFFDKLIITDKLIFSISRILNHKNPNIMDEILKNALLNEYSKYSNLENEEILHRTVVRQAIYSLFEDFLSKESNKNEFNEIKEYYFKALKAQIYSILNITLDIIMLELFKKYDDVETQSIIFKHEELPELLKKLKLYKEKRCKDMHIQINYSLSKEEFNLMNEILKNSKDFFLNKDIDVFKDETISQINNFLIKAYSMSLEKKNPYYGIFWDYKFAHLALNELKLLLETDDLSEDLFNFLEIETLINETTSNISSEKKNSINEFKKIYVFLVNVIIRTTKKILNEKLN